GPPVQICLAVAHHHAIRPGDRVEGGGGERLRRQYSVAAQRELDQRRGHHHGARLPRSLQQFTSGQGVLHWNLTSTRRPEYWTVRVAPPGINSTGNVRGPVGMTRTEGPPR